MDIDQLHAHCIAKPGVSESFPFDDETLVFKVKSKMFCLTNLGINLKINLKCDPEKSIKYREEFNEITSGYHMNKKHWITVDLEGRLENEFIIQLIDDSYKLVIEKLSKKEKQSINMDN